MIVEVSDSVGAEGYDELDCYARGQRTDHIIVAAELGSAWLEDAHSFDVFGQVANHDVDLVGLVCADVFEDDLVRIDLERSRGKVDLVFRLVVEVAALLVEPLVLADELLDNISLMARLGFQVFLDTLV